MTSSKPQSRATPSRKALSRGRESHRIAKQQQRRRRRRLRGIKKPDEQWDRFKPLLEILYVDYNWTTGEIRMHMLMRHHFVATERQYNYRMFTKWSWEKYNTDRTKAAGTVSRTKTRPIPVDAGDEAAQTTNFYESMRQVPEPPMAKGVTIVDGSPQQKHLSRSATDITLPAAHTHHGSLGLYYDWHKKLTADYFQAVSSECAAFELYSQLCETAHSNIRCGTVFSDQLLMTCITAASREHYDVARQLLRMFVEQDCLSPGMGTQKFLMESCLRRAAEDNAFLIASDKDMLQVISTSFLKAKGQEKFRIFDMPTFKLLAKLLSNVQGFDAENGDVGAGEDKQGGEDERQHTMLSRQSIMTCFMKQQPVCAWEDGNYDPSSPFAPRSLTSCIIWCTEQLGYSLEVPLDLQRLPPGHDASILCDHFILFSSLWQAILPAVLQNQAPSWWSEAELDFGLSPTALLGTVCHLLIKEIIFDEKCRRDEIAQKKSSSDPDTNEDGSEYDNEDEDDFEQEAEYEIAEHLPAEPDHLLTSNQQLFSDAYVAGARVQEWAGDTLWTGFMEEHNPDSNPGSQLDKEVTASFTAYAEEFVKTVLPSANSSDVLDSSFLDQLGDLADDVQMSTQMPMDYDLSGGWSCGAPLQ